MSVNEEVCNQCKNTNGEHLPGCPSGFSRKKAVLENDSASLWQMCIQLQLYRERLSDQGVPSDSLNIAIDAIAIVRADIDEAIRQL